MDDAGLAYSKTETQDEYGAYKGTIFVVVTVSITLIITITYFNSMQHVAEALYIPLHGVANLILGRYLLLKQDIDKFNYRTIVNNIV